MIYPHPNHGIITVVHRQDLELFYLLACSLRQNWRGQKQWHILLEDGDNCLRTVTDLLSSWQDWTITIDSPKWPQEQDLTALDDPNAGWWRQQSLKLWAADHYHSDCFVILDCKNILLKPADLSLWYHAGSWAIDIKPQQDTNWFWFNTVKQMGIDPIPPRASDLTPWVWPKSSVTATLARLTVMGLGWSPRQLRDHGILEFAAVWAYAQSQGLWPWHEFPAVSEFAYRPEGPGPHDSHYQESREKFARKPWCVFWTQHRRYLANDPVQEQLLMAQLAAWQLEWSPEQWAKIRQLNS